MPVIMCLCCVADDCNTQLCLAWVKRCPGSSDALATGDNPQLLPAIECSGHGVCSRAPTNCRDGDASCSAVCVCDANGASSTWQGSDCSMTFDEWQHAQDLRGQMLQTLKDAWNQTDVGVDAAAQQVSSLASLTVSNPDQISDADKLSTIAFASSLVEHIDPTNTVVVQQLLGTLGALSTQALQDAKRVLAQRLVDASRRRRLGLGGAAELHARLLTAGDTSALAQSAVNQTRLAIIAIAQNMLNDASPGEAPTVLTVRYTPQRWSASFPTTYVYEIFFCLCFCAPCFMLVFLRGRLLFMCSVYLAIMCAIAC